MRHLKAGNRLGVTTAHRRAMMRNMVTSILEYGQITCTLARAKEVRKPLEKMIGWGKEGSLHARRQALSFVKSKEAMTQLFEELAERYKDRQGGYCRIIKLGKNRLGDNSEMAIVQLLGSETDRLSELKSQSGKKKKAKKKESPVLKEVSEEIRTENSSSEKNKFRNEIELQLTKISRPLNKYVYVSSLDKPLKKLLANLIANPYDVLVDSNKQDIIQILESTRNGIQSGSVSVKDTDKSLLQIDETLSLIPGFIEKISVFNRSKNDIESKLLGFNNDQLRQKESILSMHKNDKSSLESKIRSIEKELKNTTEIIPKFVKSAESILNEISAVQYVIRTE